LARVRHLPYAEHPEIRRMIGYRDSCAPVEVSFPADTLHDARVARWLREHRLAVDVRTVSELHSAISVGIHPVLMTVHAERLDTRDLRRVSAAGVGRVVLDGSEHISSLRPRRTQNVLLRMANTSTVTDADNAVASVVDCRSTTLIGLLCEIGMEADDFVNCPEAIGNMVAQMAHIRRHHDIVLTRLVLGVGHVDAASSIVRRDLAEEIDEALGDACAAMRFPRPSIVMAA
jgi:diaminopimelate decarboxylase